MRLRFSFLTIAILSLAVPQVSSANTQTFTSNGTFTVPANVSALTVEAVGGGGGGGGGTNEGTGTGGGGGGYSVLTFPVTSGEVYNVVVGAGGAGGGVPHCEPGASSIGGDGGTSSFSNANLNVYATGGQGGRTGGLSGWGGPGGIPGTGFTAPGQFGGSATIRYNGETKRWTPSGPPGGASGTGAAGGAGFTCIFTPPSAEPFYMDCTDVNYVYTETGWVPDSSYALPFINATSGNSWGGGGGGTGTSATCDNYIMYPPHLPGAGALGVVAVSYHVGGTVTVSSNISSYWTLTGPAIDFNLGTTYGSGNTSLYVKPSGTYNITWSDVYGYTTPAPQSLSLAPNGIITFNGIYSCANIACTSYPNVCGQTNSGIYDCNNNMLCSATTPANPTGYGNVCSTAANSCGDSNFGFIQCDGSCSAGTAAPAERPYWHNTCTLTSAPNACGQTTTAATGGTIGCDGTTCTGTPPPAPPITTPTGKSYLGSCTLTSTSNSCGMTNTTSGTYGCAGTCTGTAPAAPSNASCTLPPAPTLDGLYQVNPTTGHDVSKGTNAAAYDPSGYHIFAKATSPYQSTLFNSTLTYYFEWSTDGVTWTSIPGTWSAVPMQ